MLTQLAPILVWFLMRPTDIGDRIILVNVRRYPTEAACLAAAQEPGVTFGCYPQLVEVVKRIP